MSQLFPAIKPFKTEMLKVSAKHTLYVEQSGSMDGIPVIYLHGGPGAGLGQNYRRFFDPEKYWIIGFDQRGCGQSTPLGELEENTSQTLIEDVLTIQSHLNIKRWVVFGGSWGSTLALLVAIHRPVSVISLVLRGIFLAREQDYHWYLDPIGGAAQLFPEHYQDFLKPIKSLLKHNSIVDAYHQIFCSENEVQKMAAIKAWCMWEAKISRLNNRISREQLVPDVHRAISLALLECHYIKNKCFVDEDYILQNIQSIQNIPGIIIHGRYDTVCKVEAAYSLSKVWPNSQLNIIPESGHSEGEPLTTQALCSAMHAVTKFNEEQP